MASFSTLPTELHFSILSLVLKTSHWYHHSRRDLSLVCRLWHSILNNPLLSPPSKIPEKETKSPYTDYRHIGEGAIGNGPVHGGIEYGVHIYGLSFGDIKLRIWHGLNREELGEKRMWIYKFLKEIGHNVSFPLPRTIAIGKRKSEGKELKGDEKQGELSFYRKGELYQLRGVRKVPGSFGSSYPRLRGIENLGSDTNIIPEYVSYEKYKEEPLCIWLPEGKPYVGKLYVCLDFSDYRGQNFGYQDFINAGGWPAHKFVPIDRLPAYSEKTEYVTIGEIMEYMNREVQKKYRFIIHTDIFDQSYNLRLLQLYSFNFKISLDKLVQDSPAKVLKHISSYLFQKFGVEMGSPYNEPENWVFWKCTGFPAKKLGMMATWPFIPFELETPPWEMGKYELCATIACKLGPPGLDDIMLWKAAVGDEMATAIGKIDGRVLVKYADLAKYEGEMSRKPLIQKGRGRVPLWSI